MILSQKQITNNINTNSFIFNIGGDATKKKWIEAKDYAISGEFDSICPQIYIQHYSSLQKIFKDNQAKPLDLPHDVQVGYWYWGKTGVGKTRSAIADFPDAYRKISNTKWWDGYQNELNVIIDDLDKSHSYMGYHLKIWGDKYAFVAESKGSSKYIRPSKIVVTSNYHPDQIWDDATTLEPLKRRFKIIHFRSFFDSLLQTDRDNDDVRCLDNPADSLLS